jgi:hypothetical protein
MGSKPGEAEVRLWSVMAVRGTGESTTGGRSQLRTRIAGMIMMKRGIACLGIAFSALIIIRNILPVFIRFHEEDLRF